MAGSARRDIIRDGEIATYHVWSQTAQQRFLLGRDRGHQGELRDSSTSAVPDAAGNAQGNSDPSCREEAEETGRADIEESQSEESATSKKKKGKGNSQKKAEPTYEIHNRLCQQLPDRASNSPKLALHSQKCLGISDR